MAFTQGDQHISIITPLGRPGRCRAIVEASYYGISYNGVRDTLLRRPGDGRRL
jgi:hypothetical protein